MAASKQASKQTNIDTHVRNAVTLVWGLLRLPLIIYTTVHKICATVWEVVDCKPKGGNYV